MPFGPNVQFAEVIPATMANGVYFAGGSRVSCRANAKNPTGLTTIMSSHDNDIVKALLAEAICYFAGGSRVSCRANAKNPTGLTTIMLCMITTTLRNND